MKNQKNQGFLGPHKTEVFRGKGISPLIATVILIAISIAIFGIIFGWMRSMVSEQVQKFGTPIDTECEKLVFSAKISENTIYISNQGNIPIAGINLKMRVNGKTVTKSVLKTLDGVISPGETDSIAADGIASSQKNTITPIIIGKTVKTNKMQRYLCKTKTVDL